LKFVPTPLGGAFVLKLEQLEDERGFFARTFCQEAFEAHGLNSRVVQCNVSFNRRKGTLRGMHFQIAPFAEAKLVFAHGTTDPVAEAAFLVCEALHLHPDQFESFATARVTAGEAKKVLDLITARVTARKPTAYLVNKIYMRGLPFYVDERVIVPRSFIGELLDSHFGGRDAALIDDPGAVESVLDLCTGSACLAVLASRRFPNAQIDAVDLERIPGCPAT